MKKILIPTDFSKNARDAFSYAVNLYKDTPAEFFVYNAFSIDKNPHSIMNKNKLLEIIKENAEKDMERFKRGLNAEFKNGNHQFKFIVKNENFSAGVERLVTNENIDLIVMGTSGATGAKGIFMGSNAVRLINTVDLCPILTVPKDYQLVTIRRVIVASNLKKSIAVDRLQVLKDLQKMRDLNIEIIRVDDGTELDADQQANLKTLNGLFPEDRISFKHIEKKNLIAETVQSYGQGNADLICMMNYKHSFIERLTREAVVKNMTFHSKLPLMILPL